MGYSQARRSALIKYTNTINTTMTNHIPVSSMPDEDFIRLMQGMLSEHESEQEREDAPKPE